MISPTLEGTCPRCGAEVPSLAGLALVLEDDARRLSEAYRALVGMRLAIPDVVPSTLRSTGGRWAILAAGLACHAGTCKAPAEGATL